MAKPTVHGVLSALMFTLKRKGKDPDSNKSMDAPPVGETPERVGLLQTSALAGAEKADNKSVRTTREKKLRDNIRDNSFIYGIGIRLPSSTRPTASSGITNVVERGGSV